jgi:uncharacterized C2H2 Zn-finger protein
MQHMRIQVLGQELDSGLYVYRCGRCDKLFKSAQDYVERCPECNFLFKDPRPRYKKYVTTEIDGKVIPRHRLILQSLGINLSELTVHHINGDCQDDSLDNLYLCGKEEHKEIHQNKRKNPTKGNVNEILVEQSR